MTFVVSVIAVTALAIVTGGWILGPANWPERGLAALAAGLLLYLEPSSVLAGLGVLAVVLALHVARRKKESHHPGTSQQQVTDKEAST